MAVESGRGVDGEIYSGDGARGHEIVVFAKKLENFEIFVKFLEVEL